MGIKIGTADYNLPSNIEKVYLGDKLIYPNPIQLSFITNSNSATWNPQITVNTGANTPTWAIDGYGTQQTTTPSFDLSANTANDNLNVTVKFDDYADLKSITFTSKDIVGTFDLTGFYNMAGSQYVSGNSGLTSLIFDSTTNSNRISTLYLFDNPSLTGTLDLSMFNNIDGYMRIYNTGLSAINLTSNNTSTLDLFDINLKSNPNLTSIDLSGFNRMRGSWNLGVNSSLTSLTLGSNDGGGAITAVVIQSTSLTSIDLSNFPTLGGAVQLLDNALLTSITFPSSSATITQLQLQDLPLLTTLDISGLTIDASYIRFFNNSSLTSVVMPTTCAATYFEGYNCDALTTIDLTGLTIKTNGNLYLFNSANLATVVLPAITNSINIINIRSTQIGVLNWSVVTGTVNEISINNCDFTSAESDETITLIDTYTNLTTTFNIGGTNGALTDGSVTGFDGLTAKDNLVAEGVTVTYN